MTILGLDFDLNTVLVTVVISALVYAVGSAITYAVYYLMVKGGKKSGDEIPPETHKGSEVVAEEDNVVDTHTNDDVEQVTQSDEGEVKREEEEEKEEEEEEEETNEGGDQGEQLIPNVADVIPDSDDGQIIQLTISDGQLVVATIEKTAYYFCRKKNGVMAYNLNDDEKINKKAIYNHEAIIDPFCDKTGDSVLADKAKIVKTIDEGVLDSDYKVLKKALVKFV